MGTNLFKFNNKTLKQHPLECSLKFYKRFQTIFSKLRKERCSIVFKYSSCHLNPYLKAQWSPNINFGVIISVKKHYILNASLRKWNILLCYELVITRYQHYRPHLMARKIAAKYPKPEKHLSHCTWHCVITSAYRLVSHVILVFIYWLSTNICKLDKNH